MDILPWYMQELNSRTNCQNWRQARDQLDELLRKGAIFSHDASPMECNGFIFYLHPTLKQIVGDTTSSVEWSSIFCGNIGCSKYPDDRSQLCTKCTAAGVHIGALEPYDVDFMPGSPQAVLQARDREEIARRAKKIKNHERSEGRARQAQAQMPHVSVVSQQHHGNTNSPKCDSLGEEEPVEMEGGATVDMEVDEPDEIGVSELAMAGERFAGAEGQGFNEKGVYNQEIQPIGDTTDVVRNASYTSNASNGSGCQIVDEKTVSLKPPMAKIMKLATYCLPEKSSSENSSDTSSSFGNTQELQQQAKLIAYSGK